MKLLPFSLTANLMFRENVVGAARLTNCISCCLSIFSSSLIDCHPLFVDEEVGQLFHALSILMSFLMIVQAFRAVVEKKNFSNMEIFTQFSQFCRLLSMSHVERNY